MAIIETPIDATEELIDKRTPHTKTFRLENGKNRLVSKIGLVHYKDKEDNDRLKDIDTRVQVEDGNILLKTAPYDFVLHKEGIGFDYTSKEGGKATVILSEIGDNLFRDNPTPIVEDNKIIFENVDTDLDIVIQLNRAGIQTFRILKTDKAVRKFKWSIECDEVKKFRISDEIKGIDNKDNTLRDEAKQQREIQLITSKLNETLQNGKIVYEKLEEWTGKTKFIDRETRIPELKDEAIYPVVIDPDITEEIVANTDDGNERVGGSGWQYGSIFCGQLAGDNRHPGFRFQSVNVPVGATIDLATLKLNFTASHGGGGGGNVFGSDVDSADAWSGTSIVPSNRTQTSATAVLPRYTTSGIKSIIVTSIVQEIVGRAGWNSNQNISLFAITYESTYRYTRFEDFSAAGTDEPTLEIDYTEAGGSSSSTRIYNVLSRNKWRYGDTAFSPIGYHCLGQSFPRKKVKERYPTKSRSYTIIRPNVPYGRVSFDFLTNLEFLLGLSRVGTENSEYLINVQSQRNLQNEYLTSLSRLSNNNLENLLGKSFNSTNCREITRYSTLADVSLWWSFDDTAVNSINTDYNLQTFDGNLNYSSGINNGCLLVDEGVVNYPAYTSNNPSLMNIGSLTNFTISFWFYKDNDFTSGNGNDKHVIFSITDGFNNVLRIYFTSGIDYEIHVLSSNDGTNFNNDDVKQCGINGWHHLIIRQSGSTLEYILDGGANFCSHAPDFYVISGSTYVTFGGYYSFSGPLCGMIDEAGFWTRAITNDEVNILITLSGFYPFIEGTSTSCEGIMAEYLGGLAGSKNLNAEELLRFGINKELYLEYLLRIGGITNQVNVEYLAQDNQISVIGNIPMEYLWGLTQLALLNSEDLLNVQPQSSFNNEYLLALITAGTNHSEFLNNFLNIINTNSEHLNTLSGEQSANLESLMGESVGGSANSESLGGLLRGATSNIEFLASISEAKFFNLEYLTAQLQTSNLLLECLIGLNTGQTANLEFLLSLSQNGTINCEYKAEAGAISVLGNIPIEFLTNLAVSSPLNAESLINSAFSYIAQNEHLLGLSSLQNVFSEYLVRISPSSPILGEYLTFSSLNFVVNKEYLSGVGLSVSDSLEYLLAVSKDAVLNAEIRSNIAVGGVINGETLTSFMKSNNATALEYLVGLGLTKSVALEIVQNSTVNFIIPMEFLVADAELNPLYVWIAKTRSTIYVATARENDWVANNRNRTWVAINQNNRQ